MPHLLSDFPQLSAQLSRFQALGVETLEQLQGMAQVASIELRSYLGTDVDSLIAAIPASAEAIPAEALDIIATAEYPLGVELDRVPRLDVAPTFAEAFETAPGNCRNLVAQMPPIRDQGSRGTCVAHAALAAYEQFLNAQGAYQDLSEQFLYWDCKKSDGIPTSPGTWLAIAMPLLQRDGCCLESTWAYNPLPIPGNEGQGPPPGGAQLQALSYRIASFRTIAPTSVADYRGELLAGRSVAFSIPVFNSWYRSTAVAYSGDITMPIPGEVRVGGHAMCIVGCIDLPTQEPIGGGRFIVRNSWDAKWGIKSPYGAGYGTIPYAYISRFGVEAYSVA